MDDEKIKRFQNFIYKLSQKGDIEKFIQETKSLYSDEWRHPYSVIFHILLDIYKKDANAFENITYQLQELVDSNKFNKEQQKHIFKLWDHVSLEIFRIRCWGDAYKAQEKIESLVENINKAQEELTALRSQQKNMESHYITILGIFAAIVIGATSAVSISSSSFECVTDSSALKLALGGCLHVYLCSNIVFALSITVLHRTIKKEILKSIKFFVYMFNIVIPILILIFVWFSVKYNI